MNLDDFSRCCIAKIEPQGDGPHLTVACVRRGNDGERIVHQREIALAPIIADLKEMFASHEVAGEPSELDERAGATARKIGEARLVRALHEEVAPHLGGETDDAPDSTHDKTYRLLTRARSGDPRALQVMGALVNSACMGNGRALEVVQHARRLHQALEGKQAAAEAGITTAGMTAPELAQIGGWFSSLKKVAKYATAPVWAPAYLATKGISKVPGLRQINKINPAAWAINAVEGGGKKSAVNDYRRSVRNDYRTTQDGSDESDPIDPRATDSDDGDAEVGAIVQRGYATGKNPLFEYYHRGNDTAIGADLLVGGWFSSLTRSVSKIGNQVINNNIVKAVTPIVANAIPGGGLALHAVKQIDSIVSAARQGNPVAVQAATAIVQAAKTGNPQAVETAKVMQQVATIQETKAPTPIAPPAQTSPALAAVVKSPKVSAYKLGMTNKWLSGRTGRAL